MQSSVQAALNLTTTMTKEHKTAEANITREQMIQLLNGSGKSFSVNLFRLSSVRLRSPVNRGDFVGCGVRTGAAVEQVPVKGAFFRTACDLKSAN